MIENSRWWSLFRNWLSLSGLVVSFGGFFAFLLLFAIDAFSHHANPYIGILAYVVSPFFFFSGLIVALLGAWLHRRLVRAASPAKPSGIRIDLSRPRDRKVLAAFVAASLGFLLLTAIGSNRTYHYTESVQFCGQACHEPMKPEFTAYLNSPHARVQCTECHVGAGAASYVKSKVNGVRQLYCALSGKIDRPIKTPVRNLRPAQETCEQCHWPQQFAGNLDRTFQHFLADETNTPFAVRLSLKVGGGDSSHGPSTGIHWHVNPANKVEYISSDERRQVIPWVRLTDANGAVTEYRTEAFKGEPAPHLIRKMDCIDCHNRPAHHFNSPNAAVDLAMTAGRINPAIPWVKSNSVAVLIRAYATEAEALEKIAGSLGAIYSKAPEMASLVSEVQGLYRRNFFPEMKADWRAYPDNLNHKDWPGCFRCHDGKHKTADKTKKIQASNCNSCHTILAQGSGEQLEKLSPKGSSFFHLDSINEDFSCNNCHTGAFPKE